MHVEHVLAVRLGCLVERWQDPARFLFLIPRPIRGLRRLPGARR